MEFKEFPKLARLSREIVITEKIDGTNASIFIQNRVLETELDANIVYQNTGEFTSISNETETAPARRVQKIPSVPPDMRNLDEKLNDRTGLKVKMRNYLLEITDDNNASLIMNDLENDYELLQLAISFSSSMKKHILKIKRKLT